MTLVLRVLRWTCALATLGGCTATPGRARLQQQTSFDSYSNICGKDPAGCAAAMGKDVGPAGVAGAVGVYEAAKAGSRTIDRALQEQIDRAMKECADLARSEVLLRRGFKDASPTKDDCDEIVGQNARGEPMTLARQVGIEMHAVAERCAEERLNVLRPGGFRIEQRYLVDSPSGPAKPIGKAEADLLKLRGLYKELEGSLVPDVVVHETGNPGQVLDIYDFKFPCVNVDEFIEWLNYPRGHVHAPHSQGQVYKRVFRLDGNPARVQPRTGINRHLKDGGQ